MNELPTVALRRRFLTECEQYGSQRLAVRLIARGRSAGTPALPVHDDWMTWDAVRMRAAVDYLERMRIR